MRVYDDCFGVLCINEDRKTYFELGRKKLPSIHFFDMEGNPLVEFKLNRFATSFEIDFNSGYLYTYDYRKEIFLKYDIRDVMNVFL